MGSEPNKRPSNSHINVYHTQDLKQSQTQSKCSIQSPKKTFSLPGPSVIGLNEVGFRDADQLKNQLKNHNFELQIN